MPKIKLTQYSHGQGCGCKIAPHVLDTLLHSTLSAPEDKNLLVGNSARDDAAVYDLGGGDALISTTDFFMPIVDDPATFGEIAATNAISDVYAMGGVPLMAIAIFGWPVNKLAPEIGQQVIEGGRRVCQALGITLAGGHSIDSPEPIFGLAVSGRVKIKHLKRNSTAQIGDKIYLTKPLGVGIFSTAIKRQKISPADESLVIDLMCTPNDIGAKIAHLSGVNAMTDVTGFGLGGHLSEVCRGSNVAAVLEYDQLPLLNNLAKYLDLGCLPGGAVRNFESYGNCLDVENIRTQHILCDPQTSGGLLIMVSPAQIPEFEAMMRTHFKTNSVQILAQIGTIIEQQTNQPLIQVR